MNVCIVIPVYNHGTALRTTIAALQKYDLPTLVVDDGSGQPTRHAIDELAAEFELSVIRLPQNTGKGGAVIAGLRAAAREGFSHALQIDADGQHDIEDVPKLLSASEQSPNALVSGVPRYDASAPASRVHGRRITNFWVGIETLSRRTPDLMCGFRVYPLASTIALLDSRKMGLRMDFDIEVAVRLYWRGVETVGIPTVVVYPEGGTSHFRLFRDNWLITTLHARLVFGMLLRLPILIVRKTRVDQIHWSRIGERGGMIGMRTLFAVYRLFGRRAFELLLYPVIGYFYLTDARVRKVSREYLDRIEKCRRKKGLSYRRRLNSFKHLLEFGGAVLDKGAMWAGRFPAGTIEFDDPGAYERFCATNRGSMFIGSHLGNLEVLRAFGEGVQGMTVNALVFTRHSERFNRMLAAISPSAHDNMIQVDSLGPESVGLLQDRLRDGEHVAIVADRTSVHHRERSVYVNFLGRRAPFPEGPFILAHLLGCPVYLLFCLKVAGRYRIYLELFAFPLELPRADRQAALRSAVERYARRLEYYCLLAPTQWFNFFDFWSQAEKVEHV
ncbi:glycosyltransferase family 2 protein [Candidatus Rariloculus sp.]|uniref:glycosyltransferase family 2 protein n=1 Tax=Candidatus Rariloculus sp. TaxID=3101265 RepID=UPI003D10610D